MDELKAFVLVDIGCLCCDARTELLKLHTDRDEAVSHLEMYVKEKGRGTGNVFRHRGTDAIYGVYYEDSEDSCAMHRVEVHPLEVPQYIGGMMIEE